ncbi:MAG: trypsin-like peptidase domain-containing protein, partial [Candidatus Dormibacteraeota bacterium]|nr:trypsin-like peptidase domain-containing protein [Candidatus Dormibacteraeota bacterium]
MDPFARGDDVEDEGPGTPASGRNEPDEWGSPGPTEGPIPTGPTAPGEDHGDASGNPHRGGLGDPPPEWSGYYSYPSYPSPDRSSSSPGGTYGGQQPLYPSYGANPAYWESSPAAPRRQSRPVLVAVAVMACFALLVAAAGGGVGVVFYLRNLNHAGQARAHPGRRAGAPGGNGAVDLQSLAARLDPSIVDITGVKEDATGAPVEQDAGTGVIISKGGDVLTNNHVIEGEDHLQATLANGDVHPIKVLGEDPTDDLAMVQVQGLSNLPAIPLRKGVAATMSEPVAAFGNALGRGGPPSATQGQVTNLNQTITATLDGGSARTETLSGLVEMSAQIC